MSAHSHVANTVDVTIQLRNFSLQAVAVVDQPGNVDTLLLYGVDNNNSVLSVLQCCCSSIFK